MFFRNLTMLRFPIALDMGAERLEAALAEHALKPVGPLELQSVGFVSPMGRDSEQLAHRVGGATWIALGGEEKILPAAAINSMLAKRLEEIERTDGRKPGGRARKRIREDLVHELLPKALVRPRRTDAYIDHDRGVIFVDTSSRRAAETMAGALRHALGSFPALPLNAEVAPRAVLTGWIAGDGIPDGLAIGDECELRDAADKGAVVKCQRQEMAGDEIGKHLEAGKQCTRLALTLDDRVAFVLGEDLTIRKLKLLDGAMETLESADRDDMRAELDARFALLSGEVGLLFDHLERPLRISNLEGSTP